MANAESIAGDVAGAAGGARFRRKGPVKRTVTYPHGPGVKWPRLYRKFRRKGWSKEKAARVSNEMYNKIRSGQYKRRKPRPPFPGVGGVYPAGNVSALAEGISADMARWGRVNPKTVRKGRGGLGRWFNEKWVDISRPLPEGGFAPCGRPDADKGSYPKCVPESVAMKMSQKEIDSAVRRKRAAENKAAKRKDMRDGKKPINVSTFAKADSKNVPTDTKLYEQVKAEAKRKFDVYPSAYANGWLVQEYKRRGGGYRVEKAHPKKKAPKGYHYMPDGTLMSNDEPHDDEMKKNQPSGGDVHVDRPLGSTKYENPKGGLTAAGRRKFKEETGSNLKPGVKNYDGASTADKKRWISWALRFYGRDTYPPLADEKGRPTRFALTANAWGEPVPKTEEEARRIAAKARRRQKELVGVTKRLDRNDLRKMLVEKREFSEEERSDLAEKGHAMPDGSYPIVNGRDLKNAIQAIGRAKDRAATIRHIRRRADALGLMSTLPDWCK